MDRTLAAFARAIVVVLAGGMLSSGAGEGVWESVGARGGISGNTPANRFTQMEVYNTWNLPLRPDLGRDWSMQFQLDSSAGWLSGRGSDAFVGGAGPALKFGRERLPLAFVGGCSPTWLSRDAFGDKDLGSRLQFTSHLGLELRLGSHFEVGYRYQHMSNGGLAAPNPGQNLHLLSFGYAF